MATTQTGTTPMKRLPVMEGYTHEFYDWCGKNELRFQKCTKCGTWRHVPRPMCANCHSLESEWVKVSGKGKIYCWTVVHQALDPAFASEVPYAAVIIELDEGPRMISWVTGISPDKLKVGMPVEVWFDKVTDDVTLPKFKPIAAN
jgi:uncharacterized OB-fold protein